MPTLRAMRLRHHGTDPRTIRVQTEFSSVVSGVLEHGQSGTFTVPANSPRTTTLEALRDVVKSGFGNTVHKLRIMKIAQKGTPND